MLMADAETLMGTRCDCQCPTGFHGSCGNLCLDSIMETNEAARAAADFISQSDGEFDK